MAAERAHAMLDALAERMGIEAEFRNAHGDRVSTSAATKRRLLAAMGIGAATEQEAQEALARLDRAQWLRALPRVRVIDEGAAVDIELVLPADSMSLRWRLTLERGDERSNELAAATLELLAECTLDGRRLQRRRLRIEEPLPCGYHTLEVGSAEADGSGAPARAMDGPMTLIVTPGRCWLPAALVEGRRMWGIAAQLYLLRSESNWGIGDFSDLAALIRLAAGRGADIIGLNPLHAMFNDDPEHASPYSPASRLLLNVLNIDVEAVPELAHAPDVRELLGAPQSRRELAQCRAEPLVDYARVAELKLNALHRLYLACRDGAGRTRWQAFLAFRRERGALLERNCLFLALRERFSEKSAAHADWHTWPAECRDPDSQAVQRFAREHASRIEFLAWLQWIAEEQLGAASRAAAAAGMQIGLYRDLAVGADRAGAETWVDSKAVVSGAHVGAPPDVYNPAGQDWGLPPFDPHALAEEGYRSFIDLIRANMRFAGGLRIDHVMGLQHLYWVPEGCKPTEGAYVRYPLSDLVGILALESHRHHCLVVGEDLGTVPENFRERMEQARILSYRVLFFEQDAATGAFRPPGAYPALALAVCGSHDLPTLRGWWEGRDIDLRERLGLFPQPGEAERQRQVRARDRACLVGTLRREGLLAGDQEPDIPAIARAAHAFLARTRSALAMAQIDDLTDEADPVNVPATSHEHPNWRRRLSMTLEELAKGRRFLDVGAIFAAERGGHGSRVD
jgi:4-alpha-glucanotransferase